MTLEEMIDLMGNAKNLEDIKQILNENVKTIYEDNTSLLHIAAHVCNLQIIKYLIEELKCDTTVKLGKEQLTVWEIAFSSPNLNIEVIDYIIKEQKFDLNSMFKDNETALSTYCKDAAQFNKKSMEIINYLFEQKNTNLLNKNDYANETKCLSHICDKIVWAFEKNGSDKINKIYLEAIDIFFTHIDLKSYPFEIFKCLQRTENIPEVFQYLIEKSKLNLNINIHFGYQNTILGYVTNYKACEYLIRNGCEVNIENKEGHTKLDLLILGFDKLETNEEKENCLELVKILLIAGARINPKISTDDIKLKEILNAPISTFYEKKDFMCLPKELKERLYNVVICAKHHKLGENRSIIFPKPIVNIITDNLINAELDSNKINNRI